MRPFSLLVAFLFLCPPLSVRALDDSSWEPLLTIIFPLDNKGKTASGHTEIRYVLYPSGACNSEKYVFGGDGKPYRGSDVAWLSQSHVDAVQKLVAAIGSSRMKPESPVDAMIMQGPMTHNRLLATAFSHNIHDIRLMLKLLGGVRGDLDEHLSHSKSTNQ
jgi:hypothetical protein